MFAKPNFIQSPGGGGAGGTSELPVIHELLSQSIQGGTTNERYHLTENEHSFLQNYAARGIFYSEPATIAGELFFEDGGDVLTLLVPFTYS